MNGWIVITAHQLMEVPEAILIREMRRKHDCCAAVLGTTGMHPTAVLPTATFMLRRIATSMSVFELCPCRRGLLSPLLFYPLTLNLLCQAIEVAEATLDASVTTLF